MSKPLSVIAEPRRKQVALQRVASKTRGMGYWAAVDYLRIKGVSITTE